MRTDPARHAGPPDRFAPIPGGRDRHVRRPIRSVLIRSHFDSSRFVHAPVVIAVGPQGAVGAGAVAGTGMSEAGEVASGVGWAGTASAGAAAGAGVMP